MTLYTRYELWVDSRLHLSIELNPWHSRASSMEDRKHAALVKIRKVTDRLRDSEWQLYKIKRANFAGNLKHWRDKKKELILK